ncbi:type I restriction-modification system subunit M [Thalassospira aquimaris]|uniref:site-specific DNA-methyltransferase (adenine-specific) n=1 Tax=Thalassospira aquimaris TaxID=3037796 RepID=A0ABT6GF70_9PROT|nr:type I restriction-modification system subunit M [Thalassospira sp. FZY0004]MDG4720725.1 type I restriction-modification system subunit M [Thalassospira sp. FZY0004]
MAIKKSELYSSLWSSCDELRGGMDASQYKDYVLSLLFIKYISDKYAGIPFSPITIPDGASFSDMVALKGKPDIGDQINKKIIGPLTQENQQLSRADFPDFDDSNRLGDAKEKVDRLTNLIGIFQRPALDFSKNRADGDDILGDAYEYLMRHFATESGKSKGQFYTPAEVSRILAQVIGIKSASTSANTTVYDPTCGSGSLLLKVGDEARTDVTLYGQEKDSATSGLARMNMILHDHPTAQIEQGNTIADPKFFEDQVLKQFDFVVANPPFSDKRWSTGIDPLKDPHKRFKSFGVPPAKQGDFAYLLHIIRSLKSTGCGACVLPHGVLFRGNAEADIRRKLISKGYIKGIIGLPANLFYGTGIPACIVVIDKKDAAARKGVFMIDASQGFIKEGPKNRLRSQDIHKIVDAFTRQTVIAGYSCMVPYEKIAANDYNLNLPRYIKNHKAEDKQDIEAHLKGGIPVSDVDALNPYWEVCPNLKAALFADNRAGYMDLKVDKSVIKQTIYEHPEFKAFITKMNEHFEVWRDRSSEALKSLKAGCSPKDVIFDLSEFLLNHYTSQPLIDKYDVFQHLMNYWADVMQDDLYLISADGWKAETYRIIEKDKNGKEKDKGWTCDLIPKGLIVSRYFAAEQAKIDELTSALEVTIAALTELEEEHGSEDGALNSVGNKTEALGAWNDAIADVWAAIMPIGYDEYRNVSARLWEAEAEHSVLSGKPEIEALANAKGNVTQTAVKARMKEVVNLHERGLLEQFVSLSTEIRDLKKCKKELLEKATDRILAKLEAEPESEKLADLRVIARYLELTEQIAETKSKIKGSEADLDAKAYTQYPELTEAEIKTLVVDDKWLATVDALIHGEMDCISQALTGRVRTLAERYEARMPTLVSWVSEQETKVNSHLKKMGFTW